MLTETKLALVDAISLLAILSRTVRMPPFQVAFHRHIVMALTTADKKHYRTLAHNLNPVVIIGDKGITENLLDEVNRALRDHELIKVKMNIGDRDDRSEMIDALLEATGAEFVQSIGKIVVLLKKNPKAKPKLSNLIPK